MNRIYLDNASTAFPKAPGTAEAISGYITSGCINLYRTESRLSESGFDVLMSLRSMLSSLYGYNHMECIAFTRSITESMNWIIKGLFSSGDRVAVTANEHNAVMRPLHQVGVEIFRIPSDREGYTLWEAADSIIPPGVKGLIVNAAGNVSGAVQDLGKAAEIARRYRIPLIVDTAQSSPYTSIDMEDLGIAALGFTGHKGFLGPEGTGGMILRRDLAQMISPLIAGGTGSESDSEDLPHTLPERLSPGTENLTGLTGLEASMRFTLEHRAELNANAMAMTERLHEGLSSIRGISIAGAPIDKPRVPILSITCDTMDIAEIAAQLLERSNIETRVGLHCAPSAHRSLGTFPTGTLRFSPGPFTTEDDIDTAIATMKEIVNGRSSS